MATKKIFIIEDDEDSRSLYSYILEDEGFEVKGFENAKKALDNLINCDCPDLLIMDLNFPELSAKAFVEEIKNMCHLAKLKIIVLSGDSEIQKKSEELGVLGFVKKPCELESFIQVVKKNTAQ